MPKKYSNISKDILFALGMAGILSIATTSPFFISNVANFLIRNKKYLKRKYDKYKVAKAIERFKRNRLIIISEKEGKFKVELTEKGRRKIEEIKIDDLKIKTPSMWDKKWRIIVFDIPEKQGKRARNALRGKLKKLSFYQLQKSVWVHSYPCEKEIQFLCEFFNVSRFVNIIIADKIYDDIKLRKYFDLL